MYKVIGSDQKIYGPISADQVRQWQAEGRLSQATMVLADGGNEWRPLSSVPEFAMPPVVRMPPACCDPPANGMAVAGLVLGILSNACCCFGVLFGALGLVFSLVALSRPETFPQQRGRGLAVAGLILSIIGLTCHLFVPFIFGILPHTMWHRHGWRYL